MFIKGITDKLDFIKIKKKICSTKTMSREENETSHRLRKILAKDISDKELIFKINKQVLKLNSKKISNSKKTGKGTEETPCQRRYIYSE